MDENGEMKNPASPRSEELRKARHGQMAAYAAEMAGTDIDLDRDLEAAGIELLLET
jgi:hypothetical protein